LDKTSRISEGRNMKRNERKIWLQEDKDCRSRIRRKRKRKRKRKKKKRKRKTMIFNE